DDHFIAVYDGFETRYPHDLEGLAEKGDRVAGVLLQSTREIDADQYDFTFSVMREPPLFQRNRLPKKAILRPAGGKHMVSIVRFDKRNEFAGDGSNSRNFGNLWNQGLWDGPAKQLGGTGTPNR